MRLKPETETEKDLSKNNLVNYVSIVDAITSENKTQLDLAFNNVKPKDW